MNKYQLYIAALLLLGLGSSPVLAQLYENRDENGNVIYTDTPPSSGGKQLKLPKVNVLPSPKPLNLNFEPKAKKFKYHRFSISNPDDESVVYINTTNLSINVEVFPSLRRDLGHSLKIIMDGETLVENTLTYLLGDADRGSHTLRAVIIDKQGKSVAKTAPVTVHIKKPIAAGL